jgi:hypothetical protein
MLSFLRVGQYKIKMENWKVGKNRMTVVTDSYDGLKESTGHAGEDAKKHYGGNLICESIWREKDAKLIASAPQMLEALQNLENDDNSIPEHAWRLVQDAIKCAVGNEA